MLALNAILKGTKANAYLTVRDADEYHQTGLYADVWFRAGTTTKERALITATRLLDEHVDWPGQVATSTQRLRCPRAGSKDKDGRTYTTNILPTCIANATAELAKALLVEDRTEDTATGLGLIKVDVITLDFKEASSGKSVLPESVLSILGGYGTSGSQAQVSVCR